MKKILFSLFILSGLGFSQLTTGAIVNARIKYASQYTFTVGTSGVVSKVRDAGDRWDMVFTNAITVIITNQGWNGVDTNSALQTNVAGSGNYYPYAVYLIGRGRTNSTNGISVVISTNQTSPTFLASSNTNNPSNYMQNNIYRRIGTVMISSDNGTGTLKLVPFVQTGNGRDRRTYFYQSNTMNTFVTNGGTNTTTTVCNMSNWMPTTAVAILGAPVYISSNTNGGTLTIGTSDSTAGVFGIQMNDTTANVAGARGALQEIPLVDRLFTYSVTAGAFVLRVIGWFESL